MHDSAGSTGETSTVRALIGAIVAPLAVLVIYVGFITVSNLGHPNHPPLGWMFNVFLRGAFSNSLLLGMVYGVELIMGLPLHLHLKKERLTSLWVYLLAGTFIAIAPAAIVGYLVGGPRGVVFNIGVYTLPGVAGAAIFWLIARPDRPAS